MVGHQNQAQDTARVAVILSTQGMVGHQNFLPVMVSTVNILSTQGMVGHQNDEATTLAALLFYLLKEWSATKTRSAR